jgi:hypothetical protein
MPTPQGSKVPEKQEKTDASEPKLTKTEMQALSAVLKEMRSSLSQSGMSDSKKDKNRKLAKRWYQEIPLAVDRFLTPILIGILAAGIWFFMRKLKKKPNPKKPTRFQLAQQQRAELMKKFKDLSRRSMSPRDEVIARYDLFLRIMEMAATPRALYLPPLDFHRKVRLLHPPLDPQSKKITDVFSDVLYGEQNVPPDSLKNVRGAVKEVFHYFAD